MWYPTMQRFPGLILAVQRPTCHRLQSCFPSTKISQSTGTAMPELTLPLPFEDFPFPSL
jgi:hypothetical protein